MNLHDFFEEHNDEFLKFDQWLDEKANYDLPSYKYSDRTDGGKCSLEDFK